MLIFESQREARGRTLRLLLAFAFTVLLLVLAVNAALALAWGLSWSFWVQGATFPRYFFEVNTVVTLMFVLGGWWVETSRLSRGGRAVAEQMGARLAQPGTHFNEQRFANIVDEMAVSSGMKRPQAMVLARDEGINAFATGWDEDDAVVAVTAGALDHLGRDELQGLVAHEFSHIREGDTRLNMRLMGMVFGLEMLFRMGQDLAEPDIQDRRFAWPLIGLAIMAAGWLGWVAGHALQAAVSRQREFLADARAVQWTRQRDGLGAVLRKIMFQQNEGIVLRRLGPEVQHLLLVGTESGRVAGWFDSHPPLDERVRRIYGRRMPPLPLLRADDAPLATMALGSSSPSDITAPGWTLG